MLRHFKELYSYRDLLLTLALRDIKVRYRQTFLGAAWAVAQPLAFMAIFTVVFSTFGRISSEDAPYPLFSYTGLVPWTFFATALTLAVNSIASNMSLVKKIYFPREVFPLGSILGCSMDFLIASLLVTGLMVYYHYPASIHLLWLPWLVAVEIGLVASLALFCSALNVFYRDIKYIIPLLVQLGMFVTPVIYSASRVPDHLRHWYMLNPMAVVIDGIRRIVLHSHAPELQPLLISTGVVFASLLLAYGYFKRAELKFADLI